ncbi:FGGY-family carbohydrate kinase [Sphingomonas sp. PAMC 26617]|uniref:FGGY-family carbohydrate kinase n=1 Tax=Sphingomonas sp. PAMC 26617 TaxID=1112216 RepID=UPI000289B9D3|nr:FGGY family carbohydrate kinase [Sphingomonas sp. PAMC 26617]
MSDTYVIGVDIGTQSTKALVLDASGQVVSGHDIGYAPSTPRPLWAEQDATVWLAAVRDAVAGAVERARAKVPGLRPADIAALCVSSLYGGSGVPVDANGEPIHPCLIWMDRRAEMQVASVRRDIDMDRLKAITGNGVDSYYGFTKMLWLRDERPDVWARTNQLLPPNAYVIRAITGATAVDHSSAGNIGGIYDLAARTWSAEMLAALGIRRDMLPERLVGSTEVVGGLSARWASELGLAEGMPVVAGGVDAAVATFAAGAIEPGHHVAMIGTSMCWGAVTPSIDARHGLVSFPNVVNADRDLYAFGGAITAGAAVTWFKTQCCDVPNHPASLAALDAAAAEIRPGSDGLVFLPYLMGERSPIWDARASGSFVGLSLFHTRAHMYRAVLEGVAFALRHNMLAGADAVGTLEEALTVVGGAARSDTWLQIIADVTNRPIRSIAQNVEAALGAGRLAALGIGLQSLGHARWHDLDDRATPDASAVEIYNRQFEIYRGLYPSLKPSMHALHLPDG